MSQEESNVHFCRGNVGRQLPKVITVNGRVGAGGGGRLWESWWVKSHLWEHRRHPAFPGQGAEVLTIEPSCSINRSLLKDQVIGCGVVSIRRKGKTSMAGFQGKSEALGEWPWCCKKVIRDKQTGGKPHSKFYRKLNNSLINIPIDPREPSIRDRHDIINTGI